MILEIHDKIQSAGEPYRKRLDPLSADAAVMHAARGGVSFQKCFSFELTVEDGYLLFQVLSHSHQTL